MADINPIVFVGLGKMGAPMASNLVKSGFDVVVFDTRASLAREFAIKTGCRAADNLNDAGREAQAVITMLPDDKAVRDVLLGANGLVSTLAAGASVIDMGTSNPYSTLEIGAELARRRINYIDAPVMGGVVFAEDATLDIMVGGQDDIIDRCVPIFDVLGKSIFRCGALGSGHALKALANYVNACALANILEAMTIGRKFGLDTLTMTTALQSMCTGRQHPLDKKIIPQVVTHKFATGMALGLIVKDLTIVTDLSRSIGAAFPLAERLLDIWSEAAESLGSDVDQTDVVKLWEKKSGVNL